MLHINSRAKVCKQAGIKTGKKTSVIDYLHLGKLNNVLNSQISCIFFWFLIIYNTSFKLLLGYLNSFYWHIVNMWQCSIYI